VFEKWWMSYQEMNFGLANVSVVELTNYAAVGLVDRVVARNNEIRFLAHLPEIVPLLARNSSEELRPQRSENHQLIRALRKD